MARRAPAKPAAQRKPRGSTTRSAPKVVEQKAEVKKPDKIQLVTRRSGSRNKTDVIVNGHYVGNLSMSTSEYEMLTGCFLGQDNVEIKVVEY